jgi:hypothetical protein
VTVPFSEALQYILFMFATPVSLNPGGTGVLRLDLLSDGALKFGSTGQEHAGGRMFQSQYNAAELMANEVFYFREGVTSVNSVSGPAGIALLGLAGLRMDVEPATHPTAPAGWRRGRAGGT